MGRAIHRVQEDGRDRGTRVSGQGEVSRGIRSGASEHLARLYMDSIEHHGNRQVMYDSHLCGPFPSSYKIVVAIGVTAEVGHGGVGD